MANSINNLDLTFKTSDFSAGPHGRMTLDADRVAIGFTRFTYEDLKKALRNFSEEISRGGSGVVYKDFEIALGTAKGLAYLHDQCLEWVLHCDVKPHNLLLDENYNPMVADYGLSKQLKRSDRVENLDMSLIRGTRWYMAPEWVYNLPITAKVDVYSYGVVVLEMVTRKSPKEIDFDSVEEDSETVTNGIGECDGFRNLVRVALQCVQEKRDARPSMRDVVHMLLAH
ncbi:putative receptor protein kinase ZmPK1 [Salvia splendens]|uniref:putative receptor protein kinase ZmPK1 n=1 Tax=Salvia splendens TaxID=180675 RepID=UPI001C25909C|nr:putative receptor protein kinase ZmPK1 [Salvia splendens]